MKSINDSGVWIQDHTFARLHFCPEHGYPLMAWHRVGKLVCPVRWCPYVEVQEDDIETFHAKIEVPDLTCERDWATCPCEMHAACRRVLDTMNRRRWDMIPPREKETP